MTNEYIIDEDIANKICTVLVNCGENRLANKLCSRPAHASSRRIEQAIKELEKLANEEERLKKESKTNEPWMGHAYANSAYLKAIAILREGAK